LPGRGHSDVNLSGEDAHGIWFVVADYGVREDVAAGGIDLYDVRPGCDASKRRRIGVRCHEVARILTGEAVREARQSERANQLEFGVVLVNGVRDAAAYVEIRARTYGGTGKDVLNRDGIDCGCRGGVDHRKALRTGSVSTVDGNYHAIEQDGLERESSYARLRSGGAHLPAGGERQQRISRVGADCLPLFRVGDGVVIRRLLDGFPSRARAQRNREDRP
jgi:hypothetical protein